MNAITKLFTAVVITSFFVSVSKAADKSTYKEEDEECPDGYYEGDYSNICLHCSTICHPGMSYFKEINCNRLCPGWIDKLISPEMPTSAAAVFTTERQTTIKSGQHFYDTRFILIPIVVTAVFMSTGVFVVIGVVLGIFRRTSHSPLPMTDTSDVKLPIQVTERDPLPESAAFERSETIV